MASGEYQPLPWRPGVVAARHGGLADRTWMTWWPSQFLGVPPISSVTKGRWRPQCPNLGRSLLRTGPPNDGPVVRPHNLNVAPAAERHPRGFPHGQKKGSLGRFNIYNSNNRMTNRHNEHYSHIIFTYNPHASNYCSFQMMA